MCKIDSCLVISAGTCKSTKIPSRKKVATLTKTLKRLEKLTEKDENMSSLDNDDVRDATEVKDGVSRCKICGVKFDNVTAYEGHIAAGHLTPSP